MKGNKLKRLSTPIQTQEINNSREANQDVVKGGGPTLYINCLCHIINHLLSV